MKNSAILFSLFILSGISAYAQRPLGTWETFLPYNGVLQVAQSDERIYAATPYALFYVEKSDNSAYALTKSTGLSDANPRHIAYHTGKKTLVITYENSNIDLLVNGTDLYNIPDIKGAQTGSSKNINDIEAIGEYAYMATDLGISVLDLDKREIKENYIIGDTGQSVKVNNISSDGTYIYAATSTGLKSALLSSPNLQNYANWTVYGVANGLPRGESTMTGQLGGRFYTVVRDTLYVSASGGSGTFTKVRYDAGFSYQGMTNTNGYLYAFIWRGNESKTLRIKTDGTIDDLTFANSYKTLGIVHAGSENWIADLWFGLQRYNDNDNSYLGDASISGPPSNQVLRTAVAGDNTLYLAAGGTDPAYITTEYNTQGPTQYSVDSGWKNYKTDAYSQLNGCFDLVDVAVDNVHKKVYYASLQGGVVEQDRTTGQFTVYDTSNSSLRQYFYLSLVKVSALCLDLSQNLWMCNPGASKTLSVKTPDGKWASFFVPNDILTARQMVVDDYGQVWFGGRGSNMIVYSPGPDVLDPSDDQFITLTTGAGSGGLPNVNMWTIVKDKNGDIWVGTDQGIATFYCPGSMFSSNGCDATLIKVNQGGFIGYLFSTEIVKAMAVDGANRKWVGTTNGIWLISEDGTKELLHFTADDSPIPSNNIQSITVDEKTGEVFIGTDLGLVSYQGDAIQGDTKKGTALVYPNPVKYDYSGPIAIKGLVDNAYVKITDAAGILVYQGRANGGQMIWDGKGYNGAKVQTGVYIVYAATDMGKEHNVGKIIFIN